MNRKRKVFGQKGYSQYIEIKTIGEGSMGEVYLCDEVNLSRPVVIKRMKSHFNDSSHYEERFKKEVQILAGLQHQSIPQFYSYWKQNGELYLSMEYINGLDLKEIKDSDGIVNHVIVTLIALRILEGLAYAHRRNITHRDIKPQNLMLSSEGYVKILDFGIARIYDETENTDMNLTQPGVIIGTSAYMSPEQANGMPVTPASDLFSLGIVLLELISEKHPFLGNRCEDTMMNIANKKHIIPKGTPAFLATMINTLLKKDPNNRTSAWTIIKSLNNDLYYWSSDSTSYLSRYYGSFQKQNGQLIKTKLDFSIPKKKGHATLAWILFFITALALLFENISFIDFF